MKPQDEVKALVKRMGGVVRVERESRNIVVEPPAGHVWATSRLHYLDVEYETHNPDAIERSWRSVLEDVRGGVQKCETANCEICEEG